MTPLRRLRTWRGPPLSLQILALLLGGLVVAQVVTLFLTVLLPPAPPPQYGLGDIAAMLRDDATGGGTLERRVQATPPDITGPGWLVSERSRDDLAGLLGVAPSDVRLSFYTPLPFAGATAPPRRPDPMAQIQPPIGIVPDLVPASYLIFSQAGPGGLPGGGVPGAGLPGGGFPRGGFPSGGFPGGGLPGGGFPRGGFPGGTSGGSPGSVPAPGGSFPGGAFPAGVPTGQPGGTRSIPTISREAAPPAALPTIGQMTRPPAPIITPGPMIAPPDLIRVLPPIEPRQRPPETAAQRPAPAQPAPRSEHTQVAVAQPAAPAAPAPVAAEAMAAPRPAPKLAPPAAIFASPRDFATRPISQRPRGLFGLAPSPFVEGDFVAALRRADGGWTVVQPAAEGFPTAWQRRVALWFLIAFALVAPLGWLFARRLSGPLDRFADAAARLGRDPSAAIGVLDGPAEIGRAAHAFNLMQNRLRSFVDDRTAMVGAISHDLRTPLTRMRFRIEDAPDDLREGMLEEVTEMEEMISSVLAFIRDASTPGVRERLDLRTLLDDVAEDAAMIGGEVTVEADVAATVEVDVLGMRRVLANLVENALKYGDRARIRLHVGEEEAFARVIDDGPGLPDEELELVFQPFYRTAAARASDKRGTGLGLAVCRSIARAHGGDVRLSRSADGFTAEVRVPLVYEGERALAA